MDDFPGTIGRDRQGAAANAMLNPYPLSETDRERYRKLIAAGVCVSDHESRELLSQVYMLTHIVRLDRFFNELRAHLRPGSHVYFYHELDDAFVFVSGKSIVNSLNAVHLQAFDRASLKRVLAANGFEVTFIKRRKGSLLCIARFTNRCQLTPISAEERVRDLRAGEHVRSRFAAECAEAVEIAVAAGLARFDAKGVLRVTKSDGADRG